MRLPGAAVRSRCWNVSLELLLFHVFPPRLPLAEAAFHCQSVGYDIQLLFTGKMEAFVKYFYMQIFVRAKWKYFLNISHVGLLSLFLQEDLFACHG